MRKLNLIFLLGVVMAVLVLGGAAYLVRGRQVQRNASALLDRARKAEEQGEGAKAVEALRQYLSLRPRDGETWRWYARMLDGVTKNNRRRDEHYLVYEEALRYNPGDPALERRCVDLALELRPERTADAKRHLKVLLTQVAEKLEKGPEVPSAAMELAELKELEGKCFLLESDFEAAANAYNEAISYDPTRLFCYVQRARLDRNELHKDPKDADDEIEWMVANNPESGPAHLYRFRYLSEFRLPAPDSDLKKALELSPENPEVVLTAALVAEQKKDPAAARSYLEKGLKLHPQNADFPIALARLELEEQRPDRAEGVLRQAYQAKPSVDLAFLLAEMLIPQDKIEGGDGARVFMDYLADRGYRETLVRYLEARIEVKEKRWDKAISKIESALASMKADPRISMQLYLMLADCYTGLGWEEKRIAALRNAGEGPNGSEAARLALARSLTESGKVDEALAILVPLAEGKPELRFEIARLWIQKTLRQPVNQRNWAVLEKRLSEAEKARPEDKELATLLRVDMLTGKGQMAAARSLLGAAQATAPKNLNYRVALVRLADIEKKRAEALKILDQAEKDLGSSLDIKLARLDHWVQQGGAEAKAAVAKLAETRRRLPAADQPRFLDRLAMAEIRLGQPALARQYWRELSILQPGNLRVLMGRFGLALAANDEAEAIQLVENIRKGEGEQGTNWRFAQASDLIDRACRGDSTTLEAACTLASEIAARRVDWWGAPLLNAQLAELQNRPDQALTGYLEAVKLGNAQPAVTRRLVVLLYERNQLDEIDRLAQLLRDRGIELPELTVVEALNALRKGNYNQGIALVRQVCSDNSTSFSDQLTLGRFYYAAGRTDEAGKRFKRAMELAPGLPETWLSYIQYLVQTKHLDQAKAAVEAARQALPPDPTTLARCLMMVGDTTQAETAIQSALKKKPADPTTLRVAAGFYLDQARPDQAEQILTKLLEPATRSSPEDLAWANRTRSGMLLKTGRSADLDQALGLVEQNLKFNPNSYDDQRFRAVILALRASRRGEAIKLLEALDGSNLLGADHQFLLAQLYLGEGQENEYQGKLVKILDRKIKNPQHLAHYINFLIGRKQLDQANRWLVLLKQVQPSGLSALVLEASLLKARNRDRELLELLKTRGREIPDQLGPVASLLDRFGYIKEAEESYKAFLARDSKDPDRVLALAEHLVRHDRPREAIEICKKALTTCRQEKVAQAALPILDAPSADESQKGLVEAWLLEAIQKRPDLVILQAKLAVLRIRQNRCDEAETIYRRALSSVPDYSEALNSLAWLLALQEPAKTQEALELINRAIEIQGPIPSLVDTRAVVLIRANRIVEAVEDLRKAQDIDRANPSLALHLAWAYQTEGNVDEGRKFFRQAQELGWRTERSDPVERPLMEKLRHDLGW